MKFFKKIYFLWSNMKIRTKLTVSIIIAAIIPICLAAILFGGRLYSMVTETSISSTEKAAEDMVPLLENKSGDIISAMDRLLDTDFLTKLFGSGEITDFAEFASSADASKLADEISHIIQDTDILAVRIYADIPDSSFYESGPARQYFATELSISGTYWHGIFDGKPYTSLFCPSFYLSSSEIDALGDCAYIVRGAVNIGGESVNAYAAVYYGSGIYRQIMQLGAGFDDSVVYMINDRDAVISSTNTTLAGLYMLSYSDVNELRLTSNGMTERTVADSKVYLSVNYIESQKWYVVTVVPAAPIRRVANTVMLQLFIILAVCVLTAVIIGILQARSISSRIQTVEKHMRESREKVPVPMPAPSIHDEVGSLVDSYNFMTGQINELLDAREKDAEELRLAEFNSLQAQINPHFLYNTMDMINWMAIQGKNDEVSETVKDLAKFYRLTLSRKKPYSTIADETEHANVYMQLQNRRFGNAIEFICDIPDNLMEYRIPRLTFQPILENAVLHGIMDQDVKSGTIVITGWDEGSDIYIVISDNGRGMEADTLENILSGDRKSVSGGTNIAVYNIHRRLQLLYGDDYGLTYKSEPGAGTEVTIHIPKHLGDTKYVRPESRHSKD